MDGSNFISLYLNLPDKCIHIHNLYNLVNVKETSISIPILKRRLFVYLNKDHIILEDFNLHYEAWK